MTRRTFLPPNRAGIVIDAIAIVANLLLFPFVLSRIGNLFDRSFEDESSAFPTLAGLLFVVLFCRLAGLYIKRFSLQTHLEKAGQTTFPLYFLILNFGVLVLNSAFVVVFLSGLAADAGLIEKMYNGQPKDSPMVMAAGLIVMIALTAGESLLIYRLSVPLSEGEKQRRSAGDWKFDRRGEFLADFGLFSYMMVWQVFYNDIARTFMTVPANGTDTWEYRIFSAVFLFIVFLLFYVSPRTVFLIEDRKYLGTWVFVFGVYLVSVFRYW